MSFAYPLPWFALVPIVALLALAAYGAYAKPVIPISPVRRAALIALRFCTLVMLLLFLMRPMVIQPSTATRSDVVPVLIDSSRSMRIADVDRKPRLQAAEALARQVVTALSKNFQVEVLTFGDSVA